MYVCVCMCVRVCAGKLLVTTGTEGQLCVWDWQAGLCISKQATQAEMAMACFSEDTSSILSVGRGHFKASLGCHACHVVAYRSIMFSITQALTLL
jgi:hypothetical protein